MRIAIIGTGISGLTAAHLLHPEHEITVFEAGDYVGGHTNTIRVEREDATWDVDTGFIVLNDRNYPRFKALLDELGVAPPADATWASRSRRRSRTSSIRGHARGLLSQPPNLAAPAFVRMVADFVRFNREARDLLADGEDEPSLGAFLDDGGYSRWFVERLIVPQASAVWSADPAQMWTLPGAVPRRVLRQPRDARVPRPPAVDDRRRRLGALRRGAHRAVRRPHPRRDAGRRRRPATPRTSRSTPAGGERRGVRRGRARRHADQALAMLTDPSAGEAEILGAFPFQPNEAVLHTDARLLPRRRAARPAWNFHLLPEPRPLTPSPTT